MDPDYEPPEIETRQVYGISLQQKRNDCKIDASLFSNVVTRNKSVSDFVNPANCSCPNPPSLT